MLKKYCLIVALFIPGIILAQNYSGDVSFVEKGSNTLTLRATGVSAKKKDAVVMAAKSAFYTLFYTGVEGVNNGNPLITERKASYDTRFFDENRYNIFVQTLNELGDPVKEGKAYKASVEVVILSNALQKDLIRNKVITNLTMDAGGPGSSVKLPTVLVIPYTKEGEDVRDILDNNQMLSMAVSRVTSEFSNRGYKTKDFISQLKRLKRNDVLTAGSQSDAVAKMIQNMSADIIVTTKIFVATHAGRQSEVTLELRATEFQTDGNLASAEFLSGRYVTTDSLKLADYAFKKIQNDFFSRLQNSFNDIVRNGKEILIQMVLAKSVTEWDFESSLNNGDEFLMVMEDWLHANALNGVYSINSSDKVLDISMQIPIYDEEQGRAFTTSRFSSQLRTFLNGLFEGEYKASVVTMGQGLTVTIE
ncbi:DUF6175 family protein [Bacteroides sp. 519]|uniref:DUF6175 family protein n=1 Tax=Bacteroides sp. 519 TaxID=2302937 RepID=UPI0013D88B3D|nr:DUF6175 family protein [Bacteroides sp. 519]NDV58102.1 hypothetical protein [Bacteroides sp. 519]